MARARTRKVEVAFTVDAPRPLEASFDGEHWWAQAAGREVRLSNLEKVFWPEEGYTKGDLVAYYWSVAETILPYLAGRPLTMKRMPDGIEGPYFYEKSAPRKTPDWLSRCLVDSDNEKRVIDYLMVEDEAALLHVANLGCIEFHPLHGRCGRIDNPDYLFFDLDPMDAPFEDVLIVARLVKVALDQLGLPSYPKLSGATGMQIYVPIEPRYTHEQTRAFVGAVARFINKADPSRVTMLWEVRKRTGKVFIDHNMNRAGANIAAVYSVRPEPGASVSTPVTWEEVEEGEIRPGDFTIATIHDRLARVGDLFRPVLDAPVDLDGALEVMGVGLEDTPAPVGSRRVDAVAPAKPKRTRRTVAPTAGRSKDDETIARSKDPKLREYLSMRDFVETPEPAGGKASEGGNAFVIQKHNATRLHYDLRLERDGVMVSWAIPKGLPTTTGVRHLAVQTEDHPMEYNSFEGWIPEGHYGAGEVKIYDRGTYEPLEWTEKKVSFRLHGERVQGEWHLVKTNRDWLVLLAKASALGQPAPPPEDLRPMLAEVARQPFNDPAWRFEPKLDGIRTLAYVTTDATRLISRSGRDQTKTYPEISRLAEHVNALSAVIDGEIVAVDADGRPSFEVLQQRMNVTGEKEIDRVRRTIPVTLFAFDLLWFDGRDLTSRPLTERRERLEAIVTQGTRIQLTMFVDGDGEDFYEACKDLGFEGMLAKRKASAYLPGRRSSDWRKVKILNRQDCVILGWTPGTGGRSSMFGALLIGAYSTGTLRWIGQVGTGFTERMLDDLMKKLKPLETDEPPIPDAALRKTKGAHWVRPELVCEVEYLQQTKGGKLRAPSFKGLRPDKVPEDCLLEPPAPA
ncbi:MAG: non-homologous end-joining DNA ligase [Actinomycetota bacterium]